MKRVALLVAAVAATSATAQAADDVEIKNSGEFRVRYTNQINKTGTEDSQQNAGTDGRLKWNISARKGEKIQAYASLLHNNSFGGSNETFNTTNAAQNTLVVNRAWGWWKATDTLSFKVGRFGIELADGAVFAENDWEAIPTAHEGLQLAWDLDFAKLNVFAVKSNQYTAAAGNSDPERNFYVLSADIKNMPEVVKMANVHVVQVNKDEVAGSTPAGAQNFQHIGLTVGGDVSNFMYKFTGAFQMGSFDKPSAGTEVKLNANMFDLMVGYSMADVMGLKISAGYHMDSGDEANSADKNGTYQPFYYDLHNYAGLMDVVNWGNLSYWNLNASIVPAEDLEVGAGFYMFSRTKDTDATDSFALGRYTGLATGAKADAKDIGSEIDVFANKSYEGNFKIGARFGAFMPGAYLKDGTAKRDKTMMEAMLQASMAF